jgi:AraC-like DNA-binding protein/tetratricopeptide (TPR) repeat protein
MQKANIFDPGFIKSAISIVIDHLDQENFSGNELAEKLSLSREQTHRKLKQNLSLSTGKFIRFIRLLHACVYLIEGSDTIAEISFKVGFSSPSYFNKCFREELGISPGDLRKEGITRQITNKKILSFYRLPELHKILRSNGIHLELPEHRKTAGKSASNYDLLLADLVENKRIAVIPFSNQTGDPAMKQIGDIASSWISSQISDLEGIQTVPYFTILEYLPYMGILPNDPQNRPTFREVVGAQYFITGNYYLKDQRLYFDAQLTDAHTQEFIYNLPIVAGPKDSVMQVIEDLRLNIAGLITNLDDVIPGKVHPPNYEAYTYYLKGLNELKFGLYRSNARQYFERAVELEPEFVMANVFLTWFYLHEEEKWVSILQRMEQFQNLTNYERSVYLELYHTYHRNYREALEVTLRILDEYPQDYYFNIETAHMAKTQFFPELAIQLLSQLHDPLASDVGLLWHYYKVWVYTESLVMLGRYDEALAYLESIPVEFQNPSIPMLFIFVYVKIGKTRSEVEALIDRFAGNDTKMYAEYFTVAAYEFGLLSETDTSRYFAGKAVKIFQTIPRNKGELFDLADAFFLSGDYERARSLIKQQLEKEPESSDLIVYLAKIEASMGNASEAERIFAILGERQNIPWRRHEYTYHRDYLKARMYAQLGEIDKTMECLKSALAKGQLYHHWDFDRDIFLKPLFDHPVFQSLVEPRKYEEVTAVP